MRKHRLSPHTLSFFFRSRDTRIPRIAMASLLRSYFSSNTFHPVLECKMYMLVSRDWHSSVGVRDHLDRNYGTTHDFFCIPLGLSPQEIGKKNAGFFSQPTSPSVLERPLFHTECNSAYVYMYQERTSPDFVTRGNLMQLSLNLAQIKSWCIPPSEQRRRKKECVSLFEFF